MHGKGRMTSRWWGVYLWMDRSLLEHFNRYLKVYLLLSFVIGYFFSYLMGVP